MEWRLTRTVEYTVSIDPTDTEALRALEIALRGAHCEGIFLDSMIAEAHATDEPAVLAAILALAEVSDDSVVSDSYDCDDLESPFADDDADEAELPALPTMSLA